MNVALDAYKLTAGQLLKNPDDVRALVERQLFVSGGNAERSDVNLSLAKRAALLAPDRFEAVFNLGAALLRDRKYDDSVQVFRRAFDMAPESHKAITAHHVGLAYADAGRVEEANKAYDEALRLDPDSLTIHQSIAIAKLSEGKLSEGLYQFEVEHHVPPRKPISQSGIPRWKGEDLGGKTLIIAHEQGFGDTLQFCRVIPKMKPKTLVLSGPSSLTGLINDNFKFDAVLSEEGPFEADFVCSPMSALACLGLNYEDIDGTAYLKAEPMKLPGRGKLKVGIIWRGSSGYARDLDRSMRIEQFAPFFEIPGLAFYSLQVGEFADDVPGAGLSGFVADMTPLIKDWRDTARAVAAMDVIVSVDTATAHLAGAMGKPVLIMLTYACCWRWMHEQPTTPWYRSAKLFRQKVPGGWNIPIEGVKRELETML